MDLIFRLVEVLVPMVLSLSVHEFAHAWSAKKLGDDTAEREGRLTLDPLAHIDPVGTILLPVFAVIMNMGFFFGWAKPVPVNPVRFTRKVTMGTGMMLTASAGPVSNLLLAFVTVLILKIAIVLDLVRSNQSAFLSLCVSMFGLNVALAVFNMIPLPPLDGSRVMAWLLPRKYLPAYDSLSQYSFILLIGLLYVFGGALRFVQAVVSGILLAIVGL